MTNIGPGGKLVDELLSASARLTAAGAPYALEARVAHGRAVSAFVARPRSLHELLADAAAHGDRDCVVSGDGRRLTFAGMARAAAWQAADLRRRGVGPGDRVAIAAANGPEWLVVFWACQALGAVVVAMNTWWTSAELGNGLALTEPHLLVVDEARRERLPADIGIPLVTVEHDVVVEVGSGPPSFAPDVGEDDDALILFTSGTTSTPKAAVLTHANAIGFVLQHAFVNDRGALLSGTPRPERPPTRLAVFPLFHVSGLLGTALVSMHRGATTVWPAGRFDPAEVVALTRREGIRIWSGAVTHLVRLLDHLDGDPFDGADLLQVGIGGSAATAGLIERTERRFPHLARTFATFYGSTEAGGLISFAPNGLLRDRPGCVGLPLPGVEVRIVDEEGADVDAGAEGDICVRSALVMRTFWRNPDANAAAFLADGWLRTGDVGRMVGGVLQLAARRRDLILRGGENVYPFEVEEQLEAHPAVAEAAAYGVDDATYGQVVHAAVVLRAAAVVTEGELRAHCATVLSSYKVPIRVHLRDQPLPRNASGKVMKHHL